MSQEYSGILLPGADSAGATLRIAHGSAPAAPVNGDMWTTTAGVYVRINGATVGPFIAGTIPTAGGAPVNVTKAAASAGAAATFSRSDHKHDVTTATASGLTFVTTNAEGSATSLARSDHTHALTAPGAANGSVAFQENGVLIFDNWIRERRNIMAEFWDFPQGAGSAGAGNALLEGTPFYITIAATAILGQANRGTAYTRNALTPICYTPGARCALSLAQDTTNNGVGLPTNVGTLIIEGSVAFNALSTAADEYAFILGGCNNTTAKDGVFFEYRRTSSVNWRLIARSGGATTVTTSASAVAATSYRLRIEITASNLATFYVNGVSVGTVTTNIPAQVFPGFCLEKSVSTGSPSFIDVDYLAYMLALTTPRSATSR